MFILTLSWSFIRIRLQEDENKVYNINCRIKIITHVIITLKNFNDFIFKFYFRKPTRFRALEFAPTTYKERTRKTRYVEIKKTAAQKREWVIGNWTGPEIRTIHGPALSAHRGLNSPFVRRNPFRPCLYILTDFVLGPWSDLRPSFGLDVFVYFFRIYFRLFFGVGGEQWANCGSNVSPLIVRS